MPVKRESLCVEVSMLKFLHLKVGYGLTFIRIGWEYNKWINHVMG